MAYFVLSLAVYFAFPGAHRDKLLSPRLGAAMALAAALYLPNIVWNANNGFVSFAHTAANANLAGPLINPGEFLEFLAADDPDFGDDVPDPYYGGLADYELSLDLIEPGLPGLIETLIRDFL